MILSELVARTGISTRMAKYVLDHQIVPEPIHKVVEARGEPREFDEITAMQIALAAKLLGAGVKRNLVVQLIRKLSAKIRQRKNETPFEWMAKESLPLMLHVGDGQTMRLTMKGSRKLTNGKDFDTGWQAMDTKQGDAEQEDPDVVLRIALGRIRDKVVGEAITK